MTERLVGYFGYGSLVNRLTLGTDYVDCLPARLNGWRRHWQAREADAEPGLGADVALLTVHEHDRTAILGMLVIDRARNLASVDEREARYDRVPIDEGMLEFIVGSVEPGRTGAVPEELYVYVARHRPETEPVPHLLQSYLDTVMAGFHAEFGDEGLAHFIETTIGFERPIVADRHQPRYSRAVELDEATARRFDRLLAEAGVRFERP